RPLRGAGTLGGGLRPLHLQHQPPPRGRQGRRLSRALRRPGPFQRLLLRRSTRRRHGGGARDQLEALARVLPRAGELLGGGDREPARARGRPRSLHAAARARPAARGRRLPFGRLRVAELDLGDRHGRAVMAGGALDEPTLQVAIKRAPVQPANRSPGLSVSMALGYPREGLTPERHCTRRSPTRTPPPPNPTFYCPMDHLLFGATLRGGTQPSRSLGPPEPPEPRADQSARTNASKYCVEPRPMSNASVRQRPRRFPKSNAANGPGLPIGGGRRAVRAAWAGALRVGDGASPKSGPAEAHCPGNNRTRPCP